MDHSLPLTMRVLLIGPQTLYPWTAYTARALRRLGQEVHLFLETSLLVEGITAEKGRRVASAVPGLVPQLDRWRSAWCRRRDQRLLRLAGDLKPDLVLVLRGASFSAELLRRLKGESRCPMVTWWVDNPFYWPVDRIHGLYDTFFVFDRSYAERLRREGATDVRFLPCACDETVYHPQSLSASERARYGSEIALVAWYLENRLETVSALAQFDLKIWGRGWHRAEVQRALNGKHRSVLQGERFVPDDEAARIFSAAQIGLNIHSFQSQLGGLNSRTFDLLATGAFQLVDAVPGMEELIEPGKEVVTYRSPQEAADLARYYLRNPQERLRIAARGRERALAQHTFLHRVRSILETVIE